MASEHIFRAFTDDQFRGGWWDYYGSDGPCDEYGYRWNPSDNWAHSLSSIQQGYSSDCTKVELHTIDHKKWKVFDLPLSNLNEYNDNVGYLQIYKG